MSDGACKMVAQQLFRPRRADFAALTVDGGLYIAPPDGYVIPDWPGLYLPWNVPNYLYYPSCGLKCADLAAALLTTSSQPYGDILYTGR